MSTETELKTLAQDGNRRLVQSRTSGDYWVLSEMGYQSAALTYVEVAKIQADPSLLHDADLVPPADFEDV